MGHKVPAGGSPQREAGTLVGRSRKCASCGGGGGGVEVPHPNTSNALLRC